MREASEDEAKQLKDFWGAFYRWKNDTMPQHLSFEDWEEMREEDMNFYPED
jgi:DNA primase catalytic subunit